MLRRTLSEFYKKYLQNLRNIIKKELFYYSLKNDFILKTNKDFHKEDIPLLLKPYLLDKNKIKKEDVLIEKVIDEDLLYENLYGYKY